MTQKKVLKRLNIEDRALLYLQGENWLYDYRHGVNCYDAPGLNLNKSPWIEEWSVENARGLYQPFPWHCDYPKPLLPPARLPRSVICNGDPGLDMLLKKIYIAEDVSVMSRHFKNKFKDFNLSVKDIEFKTETSKNKKSKTSTTLPKFVADLAELMEMDPDPGFQGKYNYYFNGGSLENIKINGENVLIFPYMQELIAAPLDYHETSIWKPNLKRAAKCELEAQVFELKHTAYDCGYLVMARTKHACEFFSVVQKGDKLRMICKTTCESSVPYISADLNPFDPQQFCTVNIKSMIGLRDLATGTQRVKAEFTKSTPEDKWRSVKFQKWNPHVITVADRCCIHYMDLRQSINKPVLTMCPRPYMDEFDLISLEIPSEKEACHYVGTYLSLLMLDSRYPDDPVRQKWTHQLQSAPITGNIISQNGKEVITLSTQLTGDVKIILNTWEDSEEPHSFHFPYAPPSVLDTLRECHLLGKCLDPLLKTRLKLSTAGSQLIQDDSQNIYFFTQNSIGDIFYQGLNYEEVLDKNSYVNTTAYYALESWEKRTLAQNFVAPVVISDQSNMKTVFDAFSNKDLKYKEPVRKKFKDRERSPRRKKRPRKEMAEAEDAAPSWKHSINRLSQYTDRLAPGLLAIWEVAEQKEPLPVPQAGSTQKVLSWLRQSDDQEPTLSQETLNEEDDDCVLTPVLSQELISVSQQPDDFEHVDVKIDPELVDDVYIHEELSYVRPEVSTRKEDVSKRKETKRRSNFTVGF